MARAQGYLAPTLALRAWRSPRSIAAAKMNGERALFEVANLKPGDAA